MFGYNKKIKYLEAQIEKLVWIIENPCPYKVGQKLKSGNIITEITFYFTDFSYNENYGVWGYKSVKPLK